MTLKLPTAKKLLKKHTKSELIEELTNSHIRQAWLEVALKAALLEMEGKLTFEASLFMDAKELPDLEFQTADGAMTVKLKEEDEDEIGEGSDVESVERD